MPKQYLNDQIPSPTGERDGVRGISVIWTLDNWNLFGIWLWGFISTNGRDDRGDEESKLAQK